MSITLQRLFQRLHAGVGELGDALMGDRLERVLDTDIRRTDQTLHETREAANAVKARRIAQELALKQAKASVAQAEDEVRALLRRRHSTRAREHADQVLARQSTCRALQQEIAELKQREAEFARIILQLEHELRRMKHQLDTLRATTSLQRAQATVAQRQEGDAPHPHTALASAQRVRERAGSDKAHPPRNRKQAAVASKESDAIDAVIARLTPRDTAAASKAKTNTGGRKRS